MIYQQDTSNCLAQNIGDAGLGDDDYISLLKSAEAALENIRARYQDNSLPLLHLPETSSDLDALEERAERYCESFDDILILGTGGSSLGGKSFCELATPTSIEQPRLHFMDNIDPGTFERLFQNVAPEKTGFIVISKSGDTAETMTQFLYCLDIFRNALEENLLNQHFTVITEPGERPLRRLAEHFQIDIIDHDPGVGGRFSALSPVGMLPALIVGLEASELRAGALSVLQPVLEGISASEFAPAIGAALNIGLAKKCGVGATVIMPYLDQLTSFGLWFRQLWAESLGKSGEGTTPINALGTVDQHSQLQLYLDGPKDKMFTLVFSRVAQSGGIVPEDLADSPDLSYLAGRRMGDLLEAEQQATARTLINKNRPTRIITIDRLDEQTLGALMMHFMLETIVAADLLGVNAFDQPAVENGKILAKEYLTKMTEK